MKQSLMGGATLSRNHLRSVTASARSPTRREPQREATRHTLCGKRFKCIGKFSGAVRGQQPESCDEGRNYLNLVPYRLIGLCFRLVSL